MSVTDVRQGPAQAKPEFALIGRSNVGKSSLINMLTARKGLAKTSATPGKTQTINYFSINNQWYLVDLPGYGWARVSEAERKAWERMVKQYIAQSPQLKQLFILIDGRLSPQRVDIEFVQWVLSTGVPFAFIFTKADKAKTSELQRNVHAFLNTMLNILPGLPPYFISSSQSGRGRNEILDYMRELALPTPA